MTEQTSLFEQVGGQPFFDRLVDRFYEGVEADDVLLPLYPDHADLGGARRRLALFLGQYWGGPTTYSDERGHPRLRACATSRSRSAPSSATGGWSTCARRSTRREAPTGRQGARSTQYVTMAADAMRNRDEAAAG